VLTAAATAGVDLDALWAAYQAARITADRLTRQWEEHMMTLGGHSWRSASAFSASYQAQIAAGDAYDAWMTAYQQVYNAPPS
jgi:hypothetical protein